MTNVLLSIEDVVQLEGSSYNTIIKKVQRGKLQAIKAPTVSGYKYLLELDQLTEKAQRRYYLQIKAEKYEQPKIDGEYIAQTAIERDMRGLTASQREDVAFWKRVIQGWEAAISGHPKAKAAKTEEYIVTLRRMYPERAISERTLYRKAKALKAGGDAALADERRQSKRKGTSAIHEIAHSIFMQWWLDEARPTVTQTRRLVEAFAEIRMPELLPLPSENTFYRVTQKLPLPVLKYFRYGDKSFEDECLPYLQRTYEGFESNEIWSADYHTLDCFVRDDLTGKVFRPHAIVWIDVRSRKILAAGLYESSNSDGTIIVFRRAVQRYGIPETVYLDNGREFLVRDFGGKGRRKSDDKTSYGATILERLGVTMHNAMVRNAKAKVIERAFRNVTYDFSKFVATYTGGRPADRPERLTGLMKDADNIPLLSEIRASFEAYLEGWYNEQPSEARGLDGMTPNECYREHLIKKRTATNDELDMLLLRNERLQMVKRNGVFVKVQGQEVWFYDPEMVSRHMGQKVYVRYNPEDFAQVWVYDEQERYLCTAARMQTGGYDFAEGSDKEAIKRLNRQKRALKDNTTGFMDGLTSIYTAPDPLRVLTEKAQRNMEEMDTGYDARMIEPVAFHLPQAAGGQDYEGLVDMQRMVENARLRQGRE